METKCCVLEKLNLLLPHEKSRIASLSRSLFVPCEYLTLQSGEHTVKYKWSCSGDKPLSQSKPGAPCIPGTELEPFQLNY